MDTGLSGRTAILAASTSGLGLAVAEGLAAEGASVVISGRRGEVAAEVASRLPSALGVESDLTEPASPRRLVRAATERFGDVDVLVLNAGGPPPVVRPASRSIRSLRPARICFCEAGAGLLGPAGHA